MTGRICRLISQVDRKGVTLVELMIAIAVFAILILGLGQTVLVGQRASREAKRQANILLGCQQVLEQVQQKTVAQLIAEHGSTFQIRAAGPEGLLEDGGEILVDKDLNGDGTLQTGSLYREDRGESDLIRVRIVFTDQITDYATVIEKVITERTN
jgi:prepilin-type N-terminal cleavage/methylation domain-containing protein